MPIINALFSDSALMAWLIKNQLFTLGETWQVALCVYALNVVLAYLCLKLYDEPIRKYLAKRFLKKK